MEWVVFAQLLPYAAVTLAVVAVHLRMRSLKVQQCALDEAARVLAATGFLVRPELEQFNRGDADGIELKVALRAFLGDAIAVTIGAGAAHQARGVMRRRGLELVKRATFTIARESGSGRSARKLGLKDIEIGITDLDAALKIHGWPADTVRAVIAQPTVRNALEGVFRQECVCEVRAAACAEGGSLRVVWRLPWNDLVGLRNLAEVVERLAVALDEARWVEPVGKPPGPSPTAGTAGPASGAPFAVPGSGGAH